MLCICIDENHSREILSYSYKYVYIELKNKLEGFERSDKVFVSYNFLSSYMFKGFPWCKYLSI